MTNLTPEKIAELRRLCKVAPSHAIVAELGREPRLKSHAADFYNATRNALPALLDMAARAESAERELADAKRRIAELEEGLRPFAEEAEDWSPVRNGGRQFSDDEDIGHAAGLLIGDLRRAARLLSTPDADAPENAGGKPWIGT